MGPPGAPGLCSFHCLGVAGQEGMFFLGGAGTLRVLQGDSGKPRDSQLCPQTLCMTCSLLAPTALASHHRPVRAFCGRGCCQLYQHPSDEAEVSPWAGTGRLGLRRGSLGTGGGWRGSIALGLQGASFLALLAPLTLGGWFEGTITPLHPKGLSVNATPVQLC